MTGFKVTCKLIRRATAYKGALYEIEYAPGVFTNVYAGSRAEALARIGAAQ